MICALIRDPPLSRRIVRLVHRVIANNFMTDNEMLAIIYAMTSLKKELRCYENETCRPEKTKAKKTAAKNRGPKFQMLTVLLLYYIYMTLSEAPTHDLTGSGPANKPRPGPKP